MELRYKREAAVGILLVAATAAFVLLMMWLRGRELRPGRLVHARFDDVAGLKVGDPVRTSGVAIGRVMRIALDSSSEVEIVFTVKNGPPPRRDASATIRALDFFGARFVDFLPGTAAQPLPGDTVLRGSRAADLSEVAAGFADPARDLLGNASELVSPGTTRELRAVLIEARRTLETLGRAGEAPSRELTQALGELRRVFQRMDLVMAENQRAAGDAMRNVRDLSANLSQATTVLTHTTATIDSLLTRVNAGRGTLGALVNDSTLYQELRRTNSALGDLLVDLKANPGRYIRLRL